jgi:uncharacterized linocin/CFP29 family protein
MNGAVSLPKTSAMAKPAPTAVPIPAAASAAPQPSLGRDRVPWDPSVWQQIDAAVVGEAMRTRVARNFLPVQTVSAANSVVAPEDIHAPETQSEVLTIDEGEAIRINEYWVEFALTPTQVAEASMSIGDNAAVTLATRGANLLAQAEDLILFQGEEAFTLGGERSVFARGVRHRGAPHGSGLLGLGSKNRINPQQVIKVPRAPDGHMAVYGEHTFKAIAEAYAKFQGEGQCGAYAVVLQTTPYADAFSPLGTTLTTPADRISPLMTAGFYGTGLLPVSDKEPRFMGLVAAPGASSMDMVLGLDITTAFTQQSADGQFRFRVVERFALRLKNPASVIRLEFQ